MANQPMHASGAMHTADGAAAHWQHPHGVHGAPDGEWRAPRWVNRNPTDQELLELSHRVYKHSRRLYSEADAQGLRIYHDERLHGLDVRVVMLVPSWFPRPHVSFETVLPRLDGDAVSVVIVVRGTMKDLVGNTIANLQLLFNKLVDDQYLPDVTTDTTKVVQGWLLELLARHPELRPPGASSSGAYGGPEWTEQGIGGSGGGGDQGAVPECRPPPRRLHLNVSITGHSLGGLIGEVATIESDRFAEAHGMRWRCVSFESPGVPQHYLRAAERLRPGPGAWDETIRGYLAAPNPINMLYPHPGTVIHVLAQWEQTWSHVAKCVGADALRIAGWVAVASLTGKALSRVTGAGRRHGDDDDRAAAAPPLPPPPQPVIASAIEVQPARGGRRMLMATGRAPPFAAMVPSVPPGAAIVPVIGMGGGGGGGGLAGTGDVLSRQQCLASAPADGAGTTMASTAAAAAAAALQGAATAAAGAAARGRVGDAVAAAATGAAQQTLRNVGVGAPLGALAGLILGGSGPIGLARCLAGVLGVEVEELVAQHALGSMRPCFDSGTGQLYERYCRRMKSWPHLGDRGQVMLKAVQQVARWTLPSFLCHDNMGVWTMLSRTAMVEARCSRLAGYEPVESPTDVAFDRLYDITPEDLMTPEGVMPDTATPAGGASGVVQRQEESAGPHQHDTTPEDLMAPEDLTPNLPTTAGEAAAGGARAAASQGVAGGPAAGGVAAMDQDVALVEVEVEGAAEEGEGAAGGLQNLGVATPEEREMRRDALAAVAAALDVEMHRQEQGGALQAQARAEREDQKFEGRRRGAEELGGAAVEGDGSGSGGEDGWEVVRHGQRRRRCSTSGGGMPSDLMECDDDASLGEQERGVEEGQRQERVPGVEVGQQEQCRTLLGQATKEEDRQLPDAPLPVLA